MASSCHTRLFDGCFQGVIGLCGSSRRLLTESYDTAFKAVPILYIFSKIVV